MTQVWKYTLELSDEPQVLSIPKGAEILTVAGQHDKPALWALVEPTAVREPRTFRVFGTGRPVPYGLQFVGTAICHGGSLVWHVFEDRIER